MVDIATGQTVPSFDNMDTAVGRYIGVYSGRAAGVPEVRISDGVLKRTNGQIDPPRENTMALLRKDQPKIELPPPRTGRPHDEQPIRDTTHGHPGLPPRDYKAPREKR